MKKYGFLLIIPVAIMVLLFQSGCEKSIPESIPGQISPKYSINKTDSLFCVRIEDFLDALDDTPNDTCNFDTARYYLESSVNYHYGRATKSYGDFLIDSFDVNLTMTNYSVALYGDIKTCRHTMVDSLKAIYDNIRDTSKFMIFAMVQTLEHSSSVARFRVYTGFGWGQYVSYNGSGPFVDPTYANWQSEAPHMIEQAAVALYGYHLNGGYPVISGPSFFSDHAFRNWRWNQVKWPNNILGVNLSAGGIIDNYNDYYTFYQKNHLMHPLTGLPTVHDDLDYGELNFLTLSIDDVLIHHNYAPSGKVFYSVGISPQTINGPTDWDIRFYWETLFYGKPRQMFNPINQLNLGDWI